VIIATVASRNIIPIEADCTTFGSGNCGITLLGVSAGAAEWSFVIYPSA
jgi:hypothetical protein